MLAQTRPPVRPGISFQFYCIYVRIFQGRIQDWEVGFVTEYGGWKSPIWVQGQGPHKLLIFCKLYYNKIIWKKAKQYLSTWHYSWWFWELCGGERGVIWTQQTSWISHSFWPQFVPGPVTFCSLWHTPIRAPCSTPPQCLLTSSCLRRWWPCCCPCRCLVDASSTQSWHVASSVDLVCVQTWHCAALCSCWPTETPSDRCHKNKQLPPQKRPPQFLHCAARNAPDISQCNVANLQCIVDITKCLKGNQSWNMHTHERTQTCPGRRCWHSAASALSQPSSTCSNAFPAQHLTAVGPFQLPALRSGTLSWISSGTRWPVQTVSDVYSKHICSLDTSASSARRVLWW